MGSLPKPQPPSNLGRGQDGEGPTDHGLMLRELNTELNPLLSLFSHLEEGIGLRYLLLDITCDCPRDLASSGIVSCR